MLTPKEEYDYYMSQYETSVVLAKRDPDYLIVAARFKQQAERFKREIDERKKTRVLRNQS